MDTNRRTLMKAISRTYKEWSLHMRRCAREVGIPDSFRPIVMFLSHHPGANQKMLADHANTTTASINQTVKKMQEAGFITKETDPADQRYTRLFLTETGMEKAAQMHQRLAGSDAIITERIGADREEELIDLLHRLREIIGEEL